MSKSNYTEFIMFQDKYNGFIFVENTKKYYIIAFFFLSFQLDLLEEKKHTICLTTPTDLLLLF